jgi:hypothetical protein
MSTENDHDKQQIYAYVTTTISPLTPPSYPALPPYSTGIVNDQAEWRGAIKRNYTKQLDVQFLGFDKLLPIFREKAGKAKP